MALSLYIALGGSIDYDGKQQKRPEVSPELARLIFSQPQHLSIKRIAEECNCSTAEVRAVFWEENKWRQRLGMDSERKPMSKETREKLTKWSPEKKQKAIEIGEKEGPAAAARQTGVPSSTVRDWLSLKRRKEKSLTIGKSEEGKENMAGGKKIDRARDVLPKEKFEEHLKAGKTDKEIAEETGLELWQVKKLKKVYKLTVDRMVSKTEAEISVPEAEVEPAAEAEQAMERFCTDIEQGDSYSVTPDPTTDENKPYKVIDHDGTHEFHTQGQVIDYIRLNHSLKDVLAGEVKAFLEIKIDMEVNVKAKVS